MNFTGISRAFCKIGRRLKNVAPEIAIVGGTVGLIVAGVVACKETPKAQEVIAEHREKLENVDKCLEMQENGTLEDGRYDPELAKKDRVIIFTQTGLGLLKVYAPALVIGSLSVAAIFTGGKIFRKRVTELTTAYALLENRFAKYRNDVIERFGSDMEKELRYKTHEELIESKDENGNTKVESVKKTAYDGYSDYARIFDESNINWVKDGPRNLMFIEHQQCYANDVLHTKGVLFLNEVYDMLGFPRTPEGQLVGWVWNPDNDRIDNYVDFGITDILRDTRKFYEVQRDEERSFLLDFNCDGRILDDFTKYVKTCY